MVMWNPLKTNCICCSITKLCPTLCNSMDCNMPGFLVLRYLLEFAQIHVHWVGMPSNHLISCCPFSSCPQSFPTSGPFPMSRVFASGGHSIGLSASASVLAMNIQGWSPLGLTDLMSLQSKGLSRVFSSTTFVKHQFFGTQPSFLSNCYISTWLLGKPLTLTIRIFVNKVKSLLFDTPSRFVIAFFSRSKCLLISWLQSLSTVILEPKKIKSVTGSTFSPPIYHKVMGPDAIILVFWMF